jgi:hypothetical protein
LSIVTDSSRKTSITSYLYSSIYKNRRRQNNLHNNPQQYSYSHHQKFSTVRSNFDSESRDLVTIGNNEDIFVPTFQVLNEEDDENTVQ